MSESVFNSHGISPAFSITSEEFVMNYFTAVTRISIDGVHPPILGPGGGYSAAFELLNLWFPWIDEKLVEPKYDGVCQHTGNASNRPTFIRDYHAICLMRAVDYILSPMYKGLIVASVGTVVPSPPPTS